MEFGILTASYTRDMDLQEAVGDEAGIPKLSVVVEDNEDRLVSFWREGVKDSELLPT